MLLNANGQDVTKDTLDEIRKVMGNGDGIAKASVISTSTGLVGYNLEAPSKKLFPVLTPIRNSLPRTQGGYGVAVNWKAVTGISAGGVSSMGYVPEGRRAARMNITTSTKTANYVTLGVETDVTFEAVSAAKNFEDVMSTAGMLLLEQAMILEEFALLAGNRDVQLGTPGTPTVTVVAGGTITAGTYNVAVVGLTLEGFLSASLTNGVVQSQTVSGIDGVTYTVNGGSSNKSATASGTTASANLSLKATVPVMAGAVAYAWYCGLPGSEKLEAITTVNSVTLTSLAGIYQALTAVTADCSANNSLAFDGLLYSAFGSGLSYYNALATGNTGLTASGYGGVVEIDVMLKSFWDNYRLGPDEFFVNSKELKQITSATLGNNGSPLVRYNLDTYANNPTVVAGQVVGFYFNPFSLNGTNLIPIRVHPNMPAGTIFAWTRSLPAQYKNSDVPNIAEVDCRRDYYQIPWPIITRANQTGVYLEECLKVYATFALGIITNIGGS